MKLIYICLVIFFFSCAKKQAQNSIDIDLLKEVAILPDENFYPKGDSIFSKFLSQGKKITPQLIERITDTINSNYIYADVVNYKVGDIAIILLQNNYSYNEFPLKKMMLKNFYPDDNIDDYQYTVLYDKILFNNTTSVNFSNRIKLKNIIKRWFENKK